MILSKRQQQIVEAPEDKIVVIAAAAAGKSAILTERAKWAIAHGEDPEKMALITFTNAAAEVMRERMGNIGQGMFIGTIHSLANNFLKRVGIKTTEYIAEEQFDELFTLVKDNPYCIRQIDYVLLDEAQDTDGNQFEFILDMIKPKKIFFVGDHRQLIYAWNLKEKDCFIKLSQRTDIKKYTLNENYRNGLNILAYAKRIINKNGLEYTDNSIAMSKEKGEVTELEFSPSRMIQIIRESGTYYNWFVLTRSNKQLEEFLHILTKANIPCMTFRQADYTAKQLGEAMKKDAVKVLTIHSSKGLEADNVMVYGTIYYRQDERMVNYVAATRAKKKLYWFKKSQTKKVRYNTWE